MSQGSSNGGFNKEVLSASKLLGSPIGQNLTNVNTRTLAPSMGAVAYGSDTNLLYYGSVDAWNVAGMTGMPGTSSATGATGAAGLNGSTGSVGATGTSATTTNGFFDIAQTGISTLVVPFATGVPFTFSTLSGGISYPANNGQITLTNTGRYLVQFGYNVIQQPAQFTFYLNGVSLGGNYTVVSIWDNSQSLDLQGHISVIVNVVASNSILEIRNTLSTSGTITLSAPVTGNSTSMAYLTVIKLT